MRGQATVEMALVLPLAALLVLLVVQAALVARDQVHLTRATSAAARAAMVDPTDATAREAVSDVGGGLNVRSVRVRGDRTPGALLTVIVVASATRVPLVGMAVGSIRLREELVVRVEG
ncbi:MAG: TadE/TadG family type IV pilus assembly protein [Microthrixaceae bacterium]